MQDDIDEIWNWCHTWTMEPNAKKCGVMHYGKNNIKRDNMVTDFITRKLCLSSSSIERDLGVLVSNDGSYSQRVDWIVDKPSRTLNLLKRTFEYYNADITPFVLILGRYLKMSLWSPRFRFEIDVLKSVQRRETKARELSNVQYEIRLEKLRIMDLETRRLRGNLIQIHK